MAPGTDHDKLIFGKDERQKIVNIEVTEDGTAEIFYLDGTSEFVTHKYWVLASDFVPGSRRMNGNLHYKHGLQFNTLREFQSYRAQNRKKDTYSIYDQKEALMVKDGLTYFKGMRHKDVSVLSFDIETTSLYHDDTAKLLIISNTFRNKSGVTQRKIFTYEDYYDERKFVEAWCSWVREINPDVMTGHNIYAYDFPYLAFIASRAGANLELGRDGSRIKFDPYVSKFRKDQTQFIEYNRPRVYGREMVDTLFLSIKYDTVAKKYESYALKKIIDAEGITQEGRVFYDAATIRHNYTIPEEWEKIKAYAEFDGDDALALFDLFSPPYFYMTQSVPKSFQSMIESATGAQVNSIMVRSYLQEGHSLPKAHESIDYQGAISLGNPGTYRNVFKVDVSSLYPSIMRQYEVYDSFKDPKRNFLSLVEYFTTERLKNKKLAKDTGDRYYDDLQNAQKIVINSAYGFLGTAGLLFNSPTKADFITSKGREILNQSIDWVKAQDAMLVNADTDSVSFCYNDMRFISEEDRKDLIFSLNLGYPEKIKFEDDGFYKTVIVLKAKNYVLDDGKKMKYKGSALKASTKEKRLQIFMKELIQLMLDDKQDFKNLYDVYAKEIMNLNVMSGWCTKKTITNKVLTSERTNESKVRDAIVGEEIVEGDKTFFFFRNDGSLCLEKNFDGDYDKNKLLEKLHKTVEIFDSVLDVEQFPNYKLRKNKPALESLMKG